MGQTPKYKMFKTTAQKPFGTKCGSDFLCMSAKEQENKEREREIGQNNTS